MILLLDHEDSFVHTLAGYVRRLGHDAVVVRIGALTYDVIAERGARGIILSPGPGHPEEYPLSLELVVRLGRSIPILGVCLGHQIIAAALGATVSRAPQPRHGMTSPVRHDGSGVFRGLPSPLMATRYHSLAVTHDSLPDCLPVTAVADDDGVVMGVRHQIHPLEGVQFHPESVLTDSGLAMMRNFLERC